jgi:hypothetical protein
LIDTKEAANAANESAKIARQALVSSQRPWIRVSLSVEGPISDGNLSAIIEIENIGNYPASDVFCCTKFYFICVSNVIMEHRTVIDISSDEILNDFKHEMRLTGRFVLFPNQKRGMKYTFLNGRPGSSSASDKIFLMGVATYRFETSPRVHKTVSLRQLVWGNAKGRDIFEMSLIPKDEFYLSDGAWCGDYAD